ncbi:hypothetical protein [Candidatus Avelusimicrobium stercoris]|uniref:hypothetical protein n=1 Tax=Candidatus Avelusimicrobium stercoris TaxID=1947924 RepID=UPI003D0C3D64
MKGFNKFWRFLPLSPKALVGDPLLSKKGNDRFPTTTLGNDAFIKIAIILNLFQDLPFVMLLFRRSF